MKTVLIFLLLSVSFSSHAEMFINLIECQNGGGSIFSSKEDCRFSTGSPCIEFHGGNCKDYDFTEDGAVLNLDKVAERKRLFDIAMSDREIKETKISQAREKLKVCTKAYMPTVAKTAECLESVIEVLK